MASSEPFVLLRFQVPDEDDANEICDELEIGCRQWLTMDDSGNFSCLWPPNVSKNPAKLKGLVNKQVQPDKSWIPHPCDILSSYSNYLDAHIGLKKRLEDSSYETEKELGFGHRKRKAPKISDDDEEEEENVQKLPAPPKIKIGAASGSGVNFKASGQKKSPVKVQKKSLVAKTIEKNKTTLRIARNDRGTKAGNFDEFKKVLDKKKKEAEEKKKAAEAIKRNEDEEKVVCTSSWKAKRTPTKEDKDLLNDTLNVEDSDDDIFDPQNFGSSKLGRHETYIEDEVVDNIAVKNSVVKDLFDASAKDDASTQPPSTKNVTPPVPILGGFERKVLLSLNEINQKIEVISANQTKLNLHLIPNEKVLSRPEGMPSVPLQTLADLKEMERVLKEDSDTVSTLSTYLSTYVSKDPKKEDKSAKKVMVSLMSNSVAKEYSLKGQKGKLRFDELTVWNAVKGAILLKIETDLSETEMAVQKWMKDAAYRKQSDGSVSKQRAKKKSPKKTSPRKKSSPRKTSSPRKKFSPRKTSSPTK